MTQRYCILFSCANFLESRQFGSYPASAAELVLCEVGQSRAIHSRITGYSQKRPGGLREIVGIRTPRDPFGPNGFADRWAGNSCIGIYWDKDYAWGKTGSRP